MNQKTQQRFDGRATCGDGASTGEDTLRLIASLEAPEGLEERIHEALGRERDEGRQRVRVLAWPRRLRTDAAWTKAAAAAAIVCVVAGGSWGVYSRVEQPAKAIAMPAHMAAPGSFSGADAMRVPEMLNRPALKQPAKAHPAHGKTVKKGAARSGEKGAGAKTTEPAAAQTKP